MTAPALGRKGWSVCAVGGMQLYLFLLSGKSEAAQKFHQLTSICHIGQRLESPVPFPHLIKEAGKSMLASSALKVEEGKGERWLAMGVE